MVLKSRTSVVLTALLLVGIAGCTQNGTASAPGASTSAASAPAASASAVPASASAAPESTSAGATPSSASPAAPGAQALFPLAIHRRGGFAGVDDRASVAADGSVVVTRRGKGTVRTSLPAGTMAELRRLLTAPDLRAAPSNAPVCNDGYEYAFTSPSSTAVGYDCNVPQGASLDKLLTIAGQLFDS
ncbi:hypothetical protein [Couchioplanes azureus]|uniref:hypothetical protein n=1 Tax=Couchioplanes caeruleus TaxID=56438 RepID=UPI0016716B6F|nr:hypothetical protein [Couchioplanes caeruleus]GGQ72372.1 hypothetical protein GCM10010166_47830 [Couchioplanes caeruleus subsp. azureus]